jgi:GT2 family glycosyltransferase
VAVREAGSDPVATAPDGLEVRFIEVRAAAGAAAARNMGWRATDAPLIAFTDDDCRPSPGWLDALLAAAGGEDRLLQGPTEPDPDERERLYALATTQVITEPSAWYQTCNIAYPRRLLERLDGFDERFDGGEDADLGLRAIEAGAERVWVDDALVWHAVHSRHVWDAVRGHARWHSIPLVIAEHPQQREALELRLFWREGHSRVLLAAAGLLAVRRHPAVALAAAAPYIRWHLASYRRSPRSVVRAALDLPSRAAVDLTGLAATARSAAHHRTPVL